MLVEIPNLRRCCCCMPLRWGILTFAYLNLGVTLFFGILQLTIWVLLHTDHKYQPVAMYRGVILDAHLFFVIALHALDVVFNVVLIVGAHMKNSLIMRVYYYYQLSTMIATFLSLVISFYVERNNWVGAMSELSIAFVGFVVQIYLLLLLHNELNKQRYREGRSSFVNQMSEVCLEPPIREDRRTLL